MEGGLADPGLSGITFFVECLTISKHPSKHSSALVLIYPKLHREAFEYL